MTKFGFSILSIRKVQLIFVLLLSFFVYQCVILRLQSDLSLMDYNNNTQLATDEDNFSEMTQYWNGKPFPGVYYYTEYSTERFKLYSSIIQRDYEPLLIDIAAYRYPLNVPKCLSNQDVFIAVISAPGYFEKRQVIRETWLRHLNSSYALAFVVGLSKNATIQSRIQEENMEHGDIIQINFLDHYHNLTLKAVGLLNWINLNCPRITYVLKCDDDVYVNVPNFSDFIGTVTSKELAIYGTFNFNPPQRITGKWSLSTEEWPWYNLPLFFSGGSILISGKAVGPLLTAAQTIPFFWIDDVYLSGLATEKAGVKLRGLSRFFYIDVDAYESPCVIREHISWLTDSTEEMKASHNATEDFYFYKKSRCYSLGKTGTLLAVNFSKDSP